MSPNKKLEALGWLLLAQIISGNWEMIYWFWETMRINRAVKWYNLVAHGFRGMDGNFVLDRHGIMGFLWVFLVYGIGAGGGSPSALMTWVTGLGLFTRRHRAGAVYPHDDSDLFISNRGSEGKDRGDHEQFQWAAGQHSKINNPNPSYIYNKNIWDNTGWNILKWKWDRWKRDSKKK